MVMKKYGQMLRNEFQGYSVNRLIKDMMAGLTVAAVALPLALAFGVASGADAAAGLITAIIAGIIATILSGSSNQISGPTGAMTAILITLVAEYKMQGVFIACIMAGIIMLIAGLLKLGKLIQFIPRPVVTGFTSGIAIIIALGQIDNLFGTTSNGSSTLMKIASYGTLGFHPNWQAILCGVLVIAVMIAYPKKWNIKVPSSLIGIIVAGLASVIFKLDVITVGDIPRTLIHSDRISFLGLSGEMLINLISPAISIASLGMIESLLCGTCASNMSKKPFDANQELIAQGVANIAMPFFGGVPSTAAIARTSVAIKSGGQTRMTGIFQSVWLILCMFLLSPIMGKLPLAALAGVLIVTAWRMNEWHSIKYMFSHKMKGAIAKFLVTMAATVIFDLTIAILIGVVFALILMVAKMSKIEVEFSGVYNQKLLGNHEDVEINNQRTVVVYISGALFFANAETVINKIKDMNGSYDKFIVQLRGINYIDISAAQVMSEFLKEQLNEKKEMVFTGTRDSVMRMLRRSGFVEQAGEENFYTSVDKVLLKEERKFS
jgi:SulP family sulfate permease